MQGTSEFECRKGERDRNMDIKAKVTELSPDENWVSGTVSVSNSETGELEGECNFDYHLASGNVDFIKVSEPGWVTGASYETKLPDAIADNMLECVEAVDEAVNDWQEERSVGKGTEL